VNGEYTALWKDAVVNISRDKFSTRQENRFATSNLSPVPLQKRQTGFFQLNYSAQ
jgi:hypothetical protein